MNNDKEKNRKPDLQRLGEGARRRQSAAVMDYVRAVSYVNLRQSAPIGTVPIGANRRA